MDRGRGTYARSFTEHEMGILKKIICKYPTIHESQEDVENHKPDAWAAVVKEYNSSYNVAKRTCRQLQVLWNSMKLLMEETAIPEHSVPSQAGEGASGNPEETEPGSSKAGRSGRHQGDQEVPEYQADSSGMDQLLEEPDQSPPQASGGDDELTYNQKLEKAFHECRMQCLFEEHAFKMELLNLQMSIKELEKEIIQQDRLVAFIYSNPAADYLSL